MMTPLRIDHAQDHQADGEAGADAGGDPGSSAQAPRPAPEGGPQQAPPVEREPGDEIEDPDRSVGHGQINHEGLRRAGGDRLQRDECPQGGGEPEAREWSHDGDQKFGARGRRLVLEVRDAAEDVQRDASHLEAVGMGHQRVGQFVEQHRDEQEQGRHQAVGPVRR